MLPKSQILKRTAATVAVAALAAAPASALARTDSGGYTLTGVPDSVASAQPSSPPTVTIVKTQDSGFDWGDAAIGAGAGAALLLIGLGGTAGVVRHRHAHAPLPS